MNVEIHCRVGAKLPYNDLAALQRGAKFGEFSGRHRETFVDSLPRRQGYFERPMTGRLAWTSKLGSGP